MVNVYLFLDSSYRNVKDLKTVLNTRVRLHL